jgi:peptide-methionine (R)-S-oxide reductase
MADEWKGKLTDDQYAVLRQKGTEPPFSGAFLHNEARGTYSCAACGNPLFSSETKFDTGPLDPNTGWPHFWDPINDKSVKLASDDSYGMQRTEVTCAVCGSHLGHVFPDAAQSSGKQYCINSIALDFKKNEKSPPKS